MIEQILSFLEACKTESVLNRILWKSNLDKSTFGPFIDMLQNDGYIVVVLGRAKTRRCALKNKGFSRRLYALTEKGMELLKSSIPLRELVSKVEHDCRRIKDGQK